MSTYEAVRQAITDHGLDISGLPRVEDGLNLYRCDCEQWFDIEEHVDHVANKILDALHEVSPGASLISDERSRQDDSNDEGQEMALVCGAVSYLTPPLTRPAFGPPPMWPWFPDAWKPSPENRVRELTKAGALVAAALDEALRSRRA